MRWSGPGKRATAILSRVAGGALDLVLPISCAVCHTEGHYLCPDCESELPRLERPYCTRCADRGKELLCDWCARSRPEVDGIRAPYLFEGVVREMVHDLKYRNIRAAAPDLARLLADFLNTNRVPGDVLVPVPLHRSAERRRGYNQSQLLARELAKLTRLPLVGHALRRTRYTEPQVSMDSLDQRRTNIDGAFECFDDISGRTVLLIDDVVTTGSTMSACAEALKASGAASVWGLALARQSSGQPPTR
ncbi:MAG: ComF family protein [Chloroflexi bacterium]|nr:ComF family protein [Chloroflexota bacterium]